MVTKLGQFTKLGPFSTFQHFNCPNFVTIFCHVLKMEIIFFDIPSNTPSIAVRNSLTNWFFQTKLQFCIFSTTKSAKLKRREGSFQHFKLSKLCYHFLSSFENGNIFFDIPSNPPPIAVQNSLTNQFFKKIDVSVYFQKEEEKWQVYIGISILVIPDHMIKQVRKILQKKLSIQKVHMWSTHFLHVTARPTGQIAYEDLVLQWGPNEDYFTEKVLMGTMRTRRKALILHVLVQVQV